MTAATSERPRLTGLDLPPQGGCEADKGLCGALPIVALAYWSPACGCDPDPQKLCRGHRDRCARDALLADGWFRCMLCLDPVRLVRLEAL